MRAHPQPGYYAALFARCRRLMATLREIPQPVIAQVHGIATAAGCQLVASCDLAVASSDARFATSGINVGLFCATPAVPLSRDVSRKRAFEMLLTGEFIDARTACDWGLVNRVVPPHELAAAVAALAREITAKSRVAVETGKRMFHRQLEMTLDEASAYAAEVMARNMLARGRRRRHRRLPREALTGLEGSLEDASWRSAQPSVRRSRAKSPARRGRARGSSSRFRARAPSTKPALMKMPSPAIRRAPAPG